jgi:cell wall-associated NlpC family hydrolase
MFAACRSPLPTARRLFSLKVCAVGLALCAGLALSATAWAQTSPVTSNPTTPSAQVSVQAGNHGSGLSPSAQAAATTAALAAVLPNAANTNGSTASNTAAVTNAAPTTASLSDPVSRFLQERGLLPQVQGEPGKLLNQVRDTASGLVLSAMNFLGVRYARGGKTEESGFDCSGFTRYIFELSIGMVLPHRAEEQARLASLLQVKRDELKPGDLVFFNTMRRTFSHVGIYVGEGKFIHSPRVGGAVRVEDMRDAYWAKRFTGARRADLKNPADGSALAQPGR